MTRPEITAELSTMIEKKINPNNDPRIYWAKEVTFDYSTNHAVRVNYMKFVPVNNSVSGIEKGDCYCYEIKSSIEDFKSGHGLNFIGDQLFGYARGISCNSIFENPVSCRNICPRRKRTYMCQESQTSQQSEACI